MSSEIIVLLVAVAVVLVIMVVRRQPGDATSVQNHTGGTTPELWRSSSAMALPQIVVPPRDFDAVGRAVLEHLRQLEDRAAPGLTAQVMPVFLKDTAVRLTALRHAVEQKDGAAAHRLAHTLHGSAATVGASSMVSTCGEIIREVRCGVFDRCDGLITDLTLDYDAIRRAVHAHGIVDPT